MRLSQFIQASKISGLKALPVLFDPSLQNEARQEARKIRIGPKFKKLPDKTKLHVLLHEAGHWFRDAHVSLSDIMGWEPGQGFYDLFGAGSSEEGFAEAFAVYALNPSELKSRYPDAYEKMEKWVGSSHEVVDWAKVTIKGLS